MAQPELDRILHDLRGPLNAMVMHLEVLRRVMTREPAAKPSLDILQNEVDRLAQMLTEAFGILALEPGDDCPLALRPLVEEAIAQQGADGVVVTGQDWPWIRGDARLLRLAIGHIVRNAVEATRASGAVRPPEIGVEIGPDTVGLVFRDWGAGLPSLSRKALLRVGVGRRPGHAGVGLLTADRIARLHRGTLAFAAPGQGAEVRLTLPREPAPLPGA